MAEPPAFWIHFLERVHFLQEALKGLARIIPNLRNSERRAKAQLALLFHPSTLKQLKEQVASLQLHVYPRARILWVEEYLFVVVVVVVCSLVGLAFFVFVLFCSVYSNSRQGNDLLSFHKVRVQPFNKHFYPAYG